LQAQRRTLDQARRVAGVGLRELRAEQVLSQQDLATRAGVSKTTVVQIEAGRIRPHPSTVRKLAAALGLPARELRDQLRQEAIT
jgi:DNA-binding XRE family transcriptional regulator